MRTAALLLLLFAALTAASAKGTYTIEASIKGGEPAKKIHLLLRTVKKEASALQHKLKRANVIRDEAAELDKRAQELNRTLDDYSYLERLSAIRAAGGKLTQDQLDALRSIGAPVQEVVRAYMGDLTKFLAQQDVGTVLTSAGKRALAKIDDRLSEPKQRREKLCTDALKGQQSQELKDCVCDFNIPWAHCDAMNYQESQKVLGDSFEHEANSPNPSFGSGQLPAGWAKHLQQLQQQQQADKAGLGYIPLGPCDADWTYSPNKPSQGCASVDCSVPIFPTLSFVLGAEGCLAKLQYNQGNLTVCPNQGKCQVYNKDNLDQSALEFIKGTVDDAYLSAYAQLCVDIGQVLPGGFRKIIEWMGLDVLCVGPTVTWWPNKNQVQINSEISVFLLYTGWKGLMQFSNGEMLEICKNIKDMDPRWYKWQMKCENYCFWSQKDSWQGTFSIYFGVDFFFYRESWTWEVFGSPKAPACDPAPQPCDPGYYYFWGDCTYSWNYMLRGGEISSLKPFSTMEPEVCCQKCSEYAKKGCRKWSLVNGICSFHDDSAQFFKLPVRPAPVSGTRTGKAPECTICEKGSWANDKYATACTPCKAGFFNEYEGSASEEECFPCPAGTNSSQPGAKSESECKSCPLGTFNSEYGAASCSNCQPGTWGNSEGLLYPEECELCLPGTYNDKEGAGSESACRPCKAGQYNPDYGATTCAECPRGTYNPDAGADNDAYCTLCPLGTFNNKMGAKMLEACRECPEGSYADEEGMSKCKACAAGTSAENPGSTECQPCEPGYFTELPGQQFCDKCLPGTYAPDSGAAQCKSCQPGRYQPSSGAKDCDKRCPAGTYSKAGATQCKKCSPGTYASETGLGECRKCLAGRFQPDSGATSCEQRCPAGQYSAAGAAQCSPCTPGTYSDTEGTITCKKCPKEQYQPGSGATSCILCPAGKTSVDGSTQCTDCPANTYGPRAGSGCMSCHGRCYSNPGATKCKCPL